MNHYWTTTQAAMARSADPRLVAQATGRSMRAVFAFRSRNGMTAVRSYTDEEDTHILHARKLGFTWHEIALQLNRTSPSIQSRHRKISRDAREMAET